MATNRSGVNFKEWILDFLSSMVSPSGVAEFAGGDRREVGLQLRIMWITLGRARLNRAQDAEVVRMKMAQSGSPE